MSKSTFTAGKDDPEGAHVIFRKLHMIPSGSALSAIKVLSHDKILNPFLSTMVSNLREVPAGDLSPRSH